jgi:hypothetical protein
MRMDWDSPVLCGPQISTSCARPVRLPIIMMTRLADARARGDQTRRA